VDDGTPCGDRACGAGLECVDETISNPAIIVGLCREPGQLGAQCDATQAFLERDGCVDGLICTGTPPACAPPG
jgi:hypothetical protein